MLIGLDVRSFLHSSGAVVYVIVWALDGDMLKRQRPFLYTVYGYSKPYSIFTPRKKKKILAQFGTAKTDM